jgi:hypothetical protein
LYKKLTKLLKDSKAEPPKSSKTSKLVALLQGSGSQDARSAATGDEVDMEEVESLRRVFGGNVWTRSRKVNREVTPVDTPTPAEEPQYPHAMTKKTTHSWMRGIFGLWGEKVGQALPEAGGGSNSSIGAVLGTAVVVVTVWCVRLRLRLSDRLASLTGR